MKLNQKFFIHWPVFLLAVRLSIVLSLAGCTQAPPQSIEDISANPIVTEAPQAGDTQTHPADEMLDETPQLSGVQVVGWYGYVCSAPPGAQFDDILVVWPEGVTEVGLAGATPQIEAQIVALRDKPMPNKNAHFWGTLVCGVPDVGGCQLRVEQLRVDGPGGFFPPDAIEGWVGTIHAVGGPPGSGGDDYFQLDGPYPVQYGIQGFDALADQVTALRDSGQQVHIWGQMTCGIPDVGGCQILLSRIEVVE